MVKAHIISSSIVLARVSNTKLTEKKPRCCSGTTVCLLIPIQIIARVLLVSDLVLPTGQK